MSRSSIVDLLTGDVREVAPRLLGCRIRTRFDDVVTEVELTEVEAYAGDEDPASHAYRGMTRRNVAMFGPRGTLYVYRSYGIHWCMNIVTGGDGIPHAVLLRGGRPIRGRPAMEARRGRADRLTDGPGKLTEALGVTGAHDHTSVLTGPVRLLDALRAPPAVEATPRIGVSKAADEPWRWVVRD
ncbi:MAG TPA: DNA-3-methyladenine glycosylase [Acidimicrobiia bacterium]